MVEALTMLDNLQDWLSWHYWSEDAGPALWGAICEYADEVAELLRAALRVCLPSLAPADALPELAYEQNVEYPASFDAAQARAYLADPFTRWRNSGSRGRMLAELATFGLTCDVVTWRDLADRGEPGAFGGDTSCWFLVVKRGRFIQNPWGPPVRWDQAGVVWDGPNTWWDVSNHDPQLWAAILRILARWKPASTSCRFVEIWLRVDLFGVPVETARLPVWEDWEKNAAGQAYDYFNTRY